MAGDSLVGTTTTPTPEEATRLANGLVQAHLAACTQIAFQIAAGPRPDWRGQRRPRRFRQPRAWRRSARRRR